MLRKVSKYTSQLTLHQNSLLMQTRTAGFAAKIPNSNNLSGMIQWYQQNGHKHANTDPLALQK